MTPDELAEVVLLDLHDRAATEGRETHFFLPRPDAFGQTDAGKVRGAARRLEERGWATLTSDHHNEVVARLTPEGIAVAEGLPRG